MRRMRMALVVGGVLGGIVGCTKPLPNHCANNLGDLSCAEKGLGAYCSLCVLEADGCIDEEPEENCHFVGPVADTSTSDATTGDASTSGTSTSGTSTSEGGSADGTTEQGCRSHEECRARDEALPFCGEDGSCVASCGDVADGNAACASVDAAMPVCVEGSCEQCFDQNVTACGSALLGCDDELHACNCTEHEHCGNAGCNFYTGTCLPPNEVVHVGGGHAATSIAAGVASFGPGEEGTIILHEGTYANAVSISGGRVLAILAADGESPIWEHLGNNPQLSVVGATVIIDGLELSGQYGSRRALEVDGASAKVWVDRSRIVNNAGGGILVEDGGQLTLRNGFLGGDDAGVPALEVDAAVASVAYSTLIAGSGSGGGALRCVGMSSVQVEDSILLIFGNLNPVECSGAAVDHSASEQDLSSMGTGNVDVGPFGNLMNGFDWFENAFNGDFTLTPSGAAVFADIAVWHTGDPLTDIEGNPRNKTHGQPDHAGADQP